MTLLEVIRDLDKFDDEGTIYASEPFAPDSVAIVTLEPVCGGVSREAQGLGLKYVLEVFIARQFLIDWVESLDVEPSLQQKCARIIQYAIKDA